MNAQMAYLLGMITGNGEIQRNSVNTTISISIPHKNQVTYNNNNVLVYVRASLIDIKRMIDPLIGTSLNHTQTGSETRVFFTKSNEDYLIREIIRYTGDYVSHEYMRVNEYFFRSSEEEVTYFLRGLCDVTAYIRSSNYAFIKPMHRVYIEVPRNWHLVIDICNLLKKIDIPVQTIDWGHPNMRDGYLNKYNEGNVGFWKKEHQIKIYANEFIPLGFNIIHKMDALQAFVNEMRVHFQSNGYAEREKTHKYYWESTRANSKVKPNHPGEFDVFIPEEIRGQHFNRWTEIAKKLGYNE